MGTVLAAIDLSGASGVVAKQASQMASLMGRRLLLLHVAAAEPDFVGFRVGPESVRQAAASDYHKEMQFMHHLKSELAGQADGVEALVVQGSTVSCILDQILRREASLLVVGAPGHHRLHRLLQGSTVRELLARAVCPVLVVPTS